MAKRYIVLEVDDAKAEELMTALGKRSYIRCLDMYNAQDRKSFRNCPACNQKMPSAWTGTVTDQLVTNCLAIITTMIKSKSVVIYNKSFIDEVRPIDHARAVQVPYRQLFVGRKLGIIGHHMDGSQDTFYVTKLGVDFLSGKKDLKPSTLTIVEDRVIHADGTINIQDIKSKDNAKHMTTLLNVEDAIKRLPSHVVQFITSGQTSINEGNL